MFFIGRKTRRKKKDYKIFKEIYVSETWNYDFVRRKKMETLKFRIIWEENPNLITFGEREGRGSARRSLG